MINQMMQNLIKNLLSILFLKIKMQFKGNFYNPHNIAFVTFPSLHFILFLFFTISEF